MLDVKVLVGQEEEYTVKYPYLGIYKPENLIVLFYEKDRGIILSSTNKDDCQGEWLREWKEYNFERFSGYITIHNI